jgi:hypothetical protein
MKEESEWGTVFGGCSCGIPYTDGVPCHHMIAVVKSSRIEGLNPNNAMPFWWTTECWRRQYPADTNVTCNFEMDALRATPEDRAMLNKLSQILLSTIWIDKGLFDCRV